MLDTLQISCGLMIPKGTFMWPQVVCYIIQKGKGRRMYLKDKKQLYGKASFASWCAGD